MAGIKSTHELLSASGPWAKAVVVNTQLCWALMPVGPDDTVREVVNFAMPSKVAR